MTAMSAKVDGLLSLGAAAIDLRHIGPTGPNPAVSGRLAEGYFLLGQTLVTFPQCQSQAPMELLHRHPVVSSDLDPLSARYLDTLGVDPTIPL